MATRIIFNMEPDIVFIRKFCRQPVVLHIVFSDKDGNAFARFEFSRRKRRFLFFDVLSIFGLSYIALFYELVLYFPQI